MDDPSPYLRGYGHGGFVSMNGVVGGLECIGFEYKIFIEIVSLFLFYKLGLEKLDQ